VRVIAFAGPSADLATLLEESMRLEIFFGRDWLAEVVKARRVTGLANAILVHPDSLPSEYALMVTHDSK
jgi:hypothetical protein